MTSRIAPLGAAISIAGLLGWLLLSKPNVPSAEASADPAFDPVQQQLAGGSAVPCAVPLAWRLETVDDRFALSTADAEAALHDAAALWEKAAGRSLFSEDPAVGMPVRFVYDERQANLLKRLQLQGEFEAAGRVLDDRRAALAKRQQGFDADRNDYQARVAEFETQVKDHNKVVDDLNRLGGAADSTAARLQDLGNRLQITRRELDNRQNELEVLRVGLQTEADRLNNDLIDHGEKGLALERLYPPTKVEAGLYREATQQQGGRVLVIQREIEIYRFADGDDLRLVAAHELGHALGLGHSPSASALMSEETHGNSGESKGGAILPSDLDLLRARCPDLVASAPLRP